MTGHDVDPRRNDDVELSVVMPVLNAAEFLVPQLQALATQDYTGKWELVVSDNGSRDGTQEIVRSFADRLPIRIVMADGRQCPAVACNRGAATAAGRYLVFLDADDVADTSYLSAISAALEQADFAAARLDCDALNPGWIAESRSPAQKVGLGTGLFPYAYGASIGVWRSSFDRVGGFDEGFDTAQDIDFCYRMALAGSKLRFAPEAVLKYRFRTTIKGVCKQAYAYGLGAAKIRRRYPDPDPSGPRRGAGIRSFSGAARLVIISRSKGQRARGLYMLANQLGRWVGARRESRSLER